jgi:hypothetical protein
MNLEEIQAVIESAKARGADQLPTYVRGRRPEATDMEIQDAASVLLEIIESVPRILAAAAQGARIGIWRTSSNRSSIGPFVTFSTPWISCRR